MKIDFPKNESNMILWQKAAIIGSLWASIEIILGSFLHNLKIPFAGSILASIGVFILTATSKYWSERGLIIRIGLICALMKSISPSAFILGPMIGIFMEAFIFEVSTALLGKNIIGYIVAGGLAVSSNLLQKIINLFIIYGFDLIRIYNNMYQVAMNNLGDPGLSSSEIIIALFLLEYFFGVLAVLLAFRIGKSKPVYYLNYDKKNHDSHTLFSNHSSKTSIHMLFVNLILITVLLFSFKYLSIYYSMGIVAAYIYYGYSYYSLRSLSKPKYIIEFGLIILFSGLLSGGSSNTGMWISLSGIFTGVEMILRASILIIGFSIISRELRNPVILEWVFKRKMKQLYCALELAFSTLPLMIQIISNKKESIKKPVTTISYLFTVADLLIRKEISNKKIFVISGEVNSGKSSFLSKLLDNLKKRGLRTGGLLSQSIISDGKKIGYDLINQLNNEQVPFMRLVENNIESLNPPNEKKHTIGRFIFSEEALDFGNKALSIDNLENVDAIIIDEIGPSELKGDIWASSLVEILKMEDKIIILVIRESVIDDICSMFEIIPEIIFYPADDPVKASEVIALNYAKKNKN